MMTLKDKYSTHVHVKVRFDELHPATQDSFVDLAWAMVKAFDDEETHDLFCRSRGTETR